MDEEWRIARLRDLLGSAREEADTLERTLREMDEEIQELMIPTTKEEPDSQTKP